MEAESETRRVLDELRRLIEGSPLSQRRIELRAGFSRGYLSQLLSAKIDLKYRHLMAVLEVLDADRARFFRELYPAGRLATLERFRATSEPIPEATEEMLDELYGLGVESLSDLRQRVERCESSIRLLKELRAAGGESEGS